MVCGAQLAFPVVLANVPFTHPKQVVLMWAVKFINVPASHLTHAMSEMVSPELALRTNPALHGVQPVQNVKMCSDSLRKVSSGHVAHTRSSKDVPGEAANSPAAHLDHGIHDSRLWLVRFIHVPGSVHT
jgi:hypothetical protein